MSAFAIVELNGFLATFLLAILAWRRDRARAIRACVEIGQLVSVAAVIVAVPGIPSIYLAAVRQRFQSAL